MSMGLCNRMARGLQMSEAAVLAIAAGSQHSYVKYSVQKRGGGNRIICHPSRRLKALQRWLVRNVVELWPVHVCAHAYRKGAKVLKNALAHKGGGYFVRLDILRFFESIAAEDIRAMLASGLGAWGVDDIDLFLDLVCYRGALTIGAPTSPGISNAIMASVDAAIVGGIAGVTYTRYADDMFFSARTKEALDGIDAKVAAILACAKWPRGLRLNQDKTHWMSLRNRVVITGIVMGSDRQVHLGRARKREIRARIHKWESMLEGDRRSLAGNLAFARDVDPSFMNALILKYGYPAVARAAGWRPDGADRR